MSVKFYLFHLTLTLTALSFTSIGLAEEKKLLCAGGGCQIGAQTSEPGRAVALPVPRLSTLETKSNETDSRSTQVQNKSTGIKLNLKSKTTLKNQSQALLQARSNLPSYLTRSELSNQRFDGPGVIYPEKLFGDKLQGVRAGDLFQAVIEQTLKCTPSIPSPVRARILDGPLKGGIFLGEASLNREDKGLLISFDRLRHPTHLSTYSFQGVGIDLKGSVSFQGNHVAGDTSYLVAQFGSAMATGYADATISRSQNAFGNFVEEPSVSNAAKKGLVSALSKTTERLTDRIKNAPESTEIEGPILIQVIVREGPVELR